MGSSDIRKIDKNMDFVSAETGGMVWYSVDDAPLVLDGLYWRKAGEPLRRIPMGYSISGAVDATLSWQTAGAMLRFTTDAEEIRLDVRLNKNSKMDHMPATGSMGFDIYCGSGSGKKFVRTTRFDRNADAYTVPIYALNGREKKLREFTLHFPLYSGVEYFRIGFSSGATVLPPSPWSDPRPVVVYGTSIQQGGCASRPGMCHTNIMSRMLNRPFINLGFSGNGKGEPAAAELLASVKNPAMFVLDYYANVRVDGLRATLPGFIDILRRAHPETPILLVSGTPLGVELDNIEYISERLEQTAFYLDELRRRRDAGDVNIHFLDGTSLYGADPSECTVDGVHATDLGFYMIASRMAPVISGILDQKNSFPA
ncbi:MAG: SGNH/GDSL hydrolase family protein [Lentisphaeria bacterium]|nr:SGNH/GDSL hydrolase family protein [Lentisphaeria bacterium]